jgi:hypothetical protein
MLDRPPTPFLDPTDPLRQLLPDAVTEDQGMLAQYLCLEAKKAQAVVGADDEQTFRLILLAAEMFRNKAYLLEENDA